MRRPARRRIRAHRDNRGSGLYPRGHAGGVGPCAFIDPRGRLVPKEAGRLDTIIHGYEAQLAAGCQRVPRCTYDRGAFGRQVDKNEYISEDLNHFSVQGAAAAAAVAARPGTLAARDLGGRRFRRCTHSLPPAHPARPSR